jgi:N-methylhydantoinase A
MSARITVDVGGTCTDLVVSGIGGQLTVGKALTTFDQPEIGLKDALLDAAGQLGMTAQDLLAATELFVYSTTRATNAILEGTTSPTALLVTEGFPDLLVRKEGGRLRPYDFATPFPQPYVPRRLTREVPERIGADGSIVRALTGEAVDETIAWLRASGVEAVAIALVWSIANPVHEQMLVDRISSELPELAISVSHVLNPIVREYRRASSVALDASLKPLMQRHLRSIERWLRDDGYAGRLVVATSFGGVLFFDDIVERPIYTARSGPSLAPMAGKAYSAADGADPYADVVVCDTGGTSFDVSLVRDGRPIFTRETWLGEPHIGHLTGLASLDVRSVGAGGGSIAWVDPGGMLRVGPNSAGSDPGPACYGRGGTEATVTDAAATLGYLDAGSFLGGRVRLDVDAARAALGRLGAQLGLSAERAADAVLTVAGERMADAIREITINEGVDPREATIVAGGGAAGMTIVPIVDAIGCRRVLIPPTAGALSAAGGHFTDVIGEFTVSCATTVAEFDRAAVMAALDSLTAQAAEFTAGLDGAGITEFVLDHIVEARYAEQIWDLEILFSAEDLRAPRGELKLREAFDREHQRVFAVSDPTQDVELLTWKIRAHGLLTRPALNTPTVSGEQDLAARLAVFDGEAIDTRVVAGTALAAGFAASGPVLVQLPTTTIVVPPLWRLDVAKHGSFVLTKEAA